MIPLTVYHDPPMLMLHYDTLLYPCGHFCFSGDLGCCRCERMSGRHPTMLLCEACDDS